MFAIDFLLACLGRLPVGRLFGVPGHAVMPLYDALHDRDDVTPILTSHECGAAHMALHYGQASQSLGVCVATTGPGASNLLTGVATAFAEGAPLLAITGQSAQDQFGLRAYQESTGFGRTIDSVAMFRPVTKESGLMQSGPHLARTLASWIPRARSGRCGPVHISVPMNVWREAIPEAEAEALLALACQPPRSAAPSAADLDALFARIAAARQPVLLLGRGVASARAGDPAAAFAAAAGLPVITTTRGRGAIPSRLPANLGQIGMTSNPHTVQWFANAGVDLVIAVGTSLSPSSIGPRLSPAARRGARVIAVNVDESECRSVWLPDSVIEADAAAFFAAALERTADLRRLPPRALPRPAGRDAVSDVFEPRPGVLHPLQVIAALNDISPADAIFLPDAGCHWVWSMRYLVNRAANGLLTGRALGGMGQAIAGAVGVALAHPERPVVCLTGDGCFLMHGMELAVAARHAPNAIFILFNDLSLNRVYHAQQTDFGGKVISSTFPDHRFCDIASALGAAAVRVCDADAFGRAYRRALDSGRCTLIECMIDREAGLPQ